MFRRSDPISSTYPQPPAPNAHDSCVRCGRPTPQGVALCEHDNPARIKGPSATQVHGTIVLGLIGGFVLFAFLAALATAGVGRFEAAVTGRATQADGSVDVVVRVTNSGTHTSAASCRVSRGGVTGASDAVFFTEPIPAGETREIPTVLPAPAGNTATTPGTIAVRCN
ncbi:MAG TPA: hypothetical protein VK992_05185 [Candidatus Caenarcaniphilales bacterium]|nr:hypothetical protein [Candidatus Caenarcaniphilales bacterium]